MEKRTSGSTSEEDDADHQMEKGYGFPNAEEHSDRQMEKRTLIVEWINGCGASNGGKDAC